jgi:acetyl-CoA acetyltransferase
MSPAAQWVRSPKKPARNINSRAKLRMSIALRSLSRANEAIASGAFDREIVPVEVVGRKGTETITVDEQPGKANPDKIPTLKPAFAKDGTITAANAIVNFRRCRCSCRHAPKRLPRRRV